jgi:hypothetical protein
MTATARRGPLLLAALAALSLALFAALTCPGSSRAATKDAHATALKKCKRGANARKCRCPKGYRLTRKQGKYRCKKKAAAPTQDNTGTDTNTSTGTNTDPGTGTGSTTDPGTGTGTGDPPAQNSGAQTERNDAGYTSALASSRFGPRTDETNSGGISTYTYDFCANHTFSHHYEYYSSAFGQGEAYYNGNWEVEQGYRVIQSAYGPGWAGILIMHENDGSNSRIEVDFNDSAGQFSVGSGTHFTGGEFQRSAPTC